MSKLYLLLSVVSLQRIRGYLPRHMPNPRIHTAQFALSKKHVAAEVPSRRKVSAISEEFLMKDKTLVPLPGLAKHLEPSDVRLGKGTSTSSLRWNESIDPRNILALIAGILFITSTVAISETVGWEVIAQGISDLISDPQQTLQTVVDYVQEAGPMGPLIFGVVYLVAEILAVPATPLALSAGYLFGFQTGTIVVLLAATLAASAAFFIGKTFLRQWVEGLLANNADLAKIDKAIGREGFKLLLLVRLSPLFPFALSNYVYGASSIEFAPYLCGTLLGFAPGTMGIVYTGMVGHALTTGNGAQPWYIYAGGSLAVGVFLKLVADVAGNIINAMDDDDNTEGENVQ